jgi:hypothetical protein
VFEGQKKDAVIRCYKIRGDSMSSFNLPPGCSVNDLPGNRPEDVAWERFEEQVFKDYQLLDRLDIAMAVIKYKEFEDLISRRDVIDGISMNCQDESDALSHVSEFYFPMDDENFSQLKSAIDDHMSSRGEVS